MYAKQGGRCAICENNLEIDKLNVDHCHTTNKIRGLLCDQCNYGLGNFKDNVSTLTKAIKYLNENKT